MGEAGQHDMLELPELVDHRGVDARIGMPEQVDPPRAHRIQIAPAVEVVQPHALPASRWAAAAAPRAASSACRGARRQGGNGRANRDWTWRAFKNQGFALYTIDSVKDNSYSPAFHILSPHRASMDEIIKAILSAKRRRLLRSQPIFECSAPVSEAELFHLATGLNFKFVLGLSKWLRAAGTAILTMLCVFARTTLRA